MNIPIYKKGDIVRIIGFMGNGMLAEVQNVRNARNKHGYVYICKTIAKPELKCWPFRDDELIAVAI